MSRVFISIDETNPNAPKAELHINGRVLMMSEQELSALYENARWAVGHVSDIRRNHWHNLADKYKGEFK